MKTKDLSLALANLRRLRAEPGLELGHRKVLNKAERELKAVARSGKPQPDRVYRAVELICEVALEVLFQSTSVR